MAGVNPEDDARFAHLAEGNAKQARKRVAADVLIRDGAGRVLREELGLVARVGRLLVLEWQAAHGPWDDQLVFVFDGGALDEGRVAALTIRDTELAAFEFVALEDAARRLRPHPAGRLRRAARVARGGGFEYVEG